MSLEVPVNRGSALGRNPEVGDDLALLRDGREQSIPITWQRNAGIGHGSIRPMFICDCQRRAFRMYDLYGTLCCKHCAIRRGAVYASQQQSAKGRAALQAMRLRHFLGGWVGRSPSKPLFMQKRTYRRLITQLRELEAKGRTLPANQGRSSGDQAGYYVSNAGRRDRRRLMQVVQALLITPPRKPKSHRVVKGCGGESITAVVRPITRLVIRCGVARITVATVSIARVVVWCGVGWRAVAAVVRPSAVTSDASVNCTAICAAISPSLNTCNAQRRSRSSYTGISAVKR